MTHAGRIVPIILAGGSGTRLWPASTTAHPKPFLSVIGPITLLENALRHAAEAEGFARPVVSGNLANRAMLLASSEAAQAIVLETGALETAAAMTLAALRFKDRLDTCLFVMPSDHVIGDYQALFRQCHQLQGLAVAGHIVTFGVRPSRVETGYGYIEPGAIVAGNASAIARFHEKPGSAAAARMIEQGWLWNSGMFLLTAGTLLAAMARHAPAVLAASKAAMAKATSTGIEIVPDAGELAKIVPVSFDRAVMEHTHLGIVAPLETGWSDAGAWDEIWRLSPRDAQGNATRGNVVLHQTSGSLVHSAGALTVVSGLDGVVVVNTGAAVLVMPRTAAGSLKTLMTLLPGGSR